MRQRLSILLLGILFLTAGLAQAATIEVTVRNFEFDPATVTINPGDTVVWNVVQGGHNVVASDGSFSSGAVKTAPWTFSHKFNTEGTFRYFCAPHQGAGMVGTIVVGEGGSGNQGTLKLASTAVNVVEGDTATLQVNRLNGDDGAVSVTVSLVVGTASSADFTPRTSSLFWADGDDAPKNVDLATKQDNLAEANETFNVVLSSPTGGAVLDNAGKSATVTIQDDDSGNNAPSAPTNLQGHAHSTSEVMLTWNDSSGETGYRIERKTAGGTFQEVATAPANSTSAIVGGLSEATLYIFRIRAQNGAGSSGYSNELATATDATVQPCVPTATALCLNNGRFQAEVSWRTADQSGNASAVPLDFAPDSGLFYFFSQSNVEMLVKVLNACVPELGNKYWVFYAATTNVEFTLTVIDTQTGKVQAYFNPLGTKSVPVQDTKAFSCP